MPTHDQSPKAVHLHHKRALLQAELSFLKDKIEFSKKALQRVSQDLAKIGKASKLK